MTEISNLLKRMAAGVAAQGGEIYQEPYSGICSPNCPICAGSGWVRQELPVHHPKFGKLQVCPNANKAARYYKSGLVESERDLDWNATLDLNNALEAVQAVQETLEQGHGWVYLAGSNGLGKSLICKIAVAAAIRAGVQASYARMLDIMSDMKAAFDPQNPSGEAARRVDFWSTLPLLVIDEVNRVQMTEYVEERRFQLIDDRWTSSVRWETITLLAGNINPESLPDYFASRVLDRRNKVVYLHGEDVRRVAPYDLKV